MSIFLNKVEMDQLTFFKDMVEGHYMIKDIYSGLNPDGKAWDPVYSRERNQALDELGLKGKKINSLNYDNKMQFLLKILLISKKYTIQQIFEFMNKSTDGIRVRFAFQKVLQTMKSGSKKKTKRKKKSSKKKKSKRKSKKKKKSSKKKNKSSKKKNKSSKKKRRLI